MAASVFETELLLQESVVASLAPPSRATTAYVIGREVNWGPRVVDVVMASFAYRTPDSLTVPPGLAKANTLQTYVLAVLASRRRATADLLARLLHVPEAEIHALALRFLLRQGLVETTGTRCFALTGWGESLPNHIIAVETKLMDWRGALEQANSYTRVADTSYIALPDPVAAKVAAHRECLSRAGVGLMAVAGTGELMTVLPGRRHIKRRWDLVPWVERVSIVRDLAGGGERWQIARGSKTPCPTSKGRCR